MSWSICPYIQSPRKKRREELVRWTRDAQEERIWPSSTYIGDMSTDVAWQLPYCGPKQVAWPSPNSSGKSHKGREEMDACEQVFQSRKGKEGLLWAAEFAFGLTWNSSKFWRESVLPSLIFT